MIGLVVTLKVKEGKQAEFEAMANELIPQVRANEPGNVQYTLTRKEDSTTEYVFIEQYVDDAAIEAHRATAHFQKAMPVFGACLDGRPEMTRLTVLK
ncbi:MAG: putative quinol monooxygenase [Hyphomonadaceae bacterium]|nr:putative quinol monooxygenase [Hyphomonadaceae bacterium]